MEADLRDPGSPTDRAPLTTAFWLAVYTAVFWVALPWVLWAVAVRVDRALPFAIGPTWLGALPAAWGVWLLFWGIEALWRRGHGWPVSAMPPPRLVTGGPYRIARHPIYLGFSVALLGIGLMVGSAGLAFVVAPLFVPVWVGYALVEEIGLEERFGREYARYREQVGLFPRFSMRPLLWLLAALRVLRVRVVSGAEHLPRTGPAVLVSNHTCYADPVFLALVTRRVVWMAATAEAYRSPGWIGFLTRAWPAFPLRRYCPDPAAARRLVDLLAAGEVVGLFNERERSVLGAYLGTEPRVAAILPRLGVPVIPVGLQGAYAAGPRWAGTLRFPTIEARVGPPLDWGTGAPHEVLDAAIRALLPEDPQRVWLERQPLDRLHRAVWRCPSCLDEAGWEPAALRCSACGGRWEPSGDGRVRDAEGRVQTFGAWAAPVWEAPETLPLEEPVRVFRERATMGPIEPLEDRGDATLRLDADGLHWNGHHLAPAAIRSTSTERADTLQVATGDTMWQFRSDALSPFRLRNALDALRTEPPAHVVPPRPVVTAPPARDLPTVGAAVGLGVAVTEGLVLLLPLSAGNGAAGLAGAMIPMVVAYVALGAVLEVGLRRLGLPPVAIGALVLAAFAGLALASQVPLTAVAILALAGLFAWAAHDRLLWWLALPVALWGLSVALPRPSPAPAPPPDAVATGPSVVLVVLDTVRADRTSLERADRDTTPHLAALAARGTWFRRAYSPSCWSLPAHASLLTGLLPAEHGAHYEHLALPAGVPVLAEQLRAAGYETAGFSANPLVAPGTGLGRGFTHFDEPWRGYFVRETMIGWRAWHRLVAPPRDKGGAAVVAAVTRWAARRDPGRPAFVLVNLMEAHVPYQEVPEPHRSRWVAPDAPPVEVTGEQAHMAQVFGVPVPEAHRGAVSDLADGATAAADAYLGNLREVLGDDAVWIVLSDHGELFGEHEDLWGHDLGLYEPLIRVPLVVAGPGVARGTVEAPVSLVDVAPTVRALAGVAPLPAQGIDLSPALRGGSVPADRVLRAEHFRTDFLTAGWVLGRPADRARIRARRSAAVRDSRKRVRTEDGDDRGYDLAADPGEQAPLAGETTGLEVPLREPDAVAPLTPDAAQAAALRALGYLR